MLEALSNNVNGNISSSLINLKNILKEVTSVLEDNGIELNIDSWGGRGKKKIIKIPSSGHLRYDRFKQNLKDNNFITSMLEALSNNVNGNISSSLRNLCHFCTIRLL